MPSGSLPEVAPPTGSAAVTTLSLSTVPPAPEAMRRARPAAPARSLTSRPIDAVRTIFVVVASAAAASEVTVAEPALDPVGGIGGRCDRVAPLGGRGRTGVALEKARSPAGRGALGARGGTAAEAGEADRHGEGEHCDDGEHEGERPPTPASPGRVVDHARSGARAGVRSECRRLLSETVDDATGSALAVVLLPGLVMLVVVVIGRPSHGCAVGPAVTPL